MSDKKTSVTVSLDIEKAFDTIWLSGLLFKMIHSYVTDRAFKVVVNGFK